MPHSNRAEAEFIFPDTSEAGIVSPQEIAKVDIYGEHDPNNVAGLIMEQKKEEAAEKARTENAKSFESAKETIRDTFHDKLAELGIQIDGIQELNLSTEPLTMIFNNEAEGSVIFSGIICVQAKGPKFFSPSVLRQVSIDLVDSRLYDRETFWAATGGSWNQNKTDMIIDVKEAEATRLKFRMYVPKEVEVKEYTSPLQKYEIQYNLQGELDTIETRIIEKDDQGLNKASKYKETIWSRSTEAFEEAVAQVEADYAKMFGLAEFHLPRKIDLKKTFEKTTNAYMSGSMSTVLESKEDILVSEVLVN
jgi:hypothetical protein